MKTNFEKLLDKGKIKRVEKGELDFSLSKRDIIASKENFENKNYDWAFNIAYNAALQAARTLMFVQGYRTYGSNQHQTVFEFLRNTKLNQAKVDYFDSVRKKRNMAVYRGALIISENEAKDCIKEAEKFVQEIRTFVQEIRTGEKDE